jgi:protein PhnA
MTKCPQCQSENVYQDGNLWMCPECGHEWSSMASASGSASDAADLKAEVLDDGLVRDSNGTVLEDGDAVTVLKELRIKGSSSVVKVGTKAKNIRLRPDGHDGHNIETKVDGIGAVSLKSIYVRKV